jgi:bacterioferritin-associated ferredoxin
MTLSPTPTAADSAQGTDLVCHCRRVPYERVQAAIEGGAARSLADIQRTTTACTRCFGCRFELERMLEDRLGDAYVRTTYLGRPEDDAGRDGPGLASTQKVPKRMYMPVLHHARGSSVRTRVVIYHWHEGGDPPEAVEVRADLLGLDGHRHSVWYAQVAPSESVILDVAAMEGVDRLPDGFGTIKLVVSAERVGSLRPYFHFASPGGITSTHEKSSPSKESPRVHNRRYSWVFPFGSGPRPAESYFYCANATTIPLTDREFVLNCTDGHRSRAPMRDLELDQALVAPLHEYFPAMLDPERAGTVRVRPEAHLAGHIIRYEPDVDLWRVQHL